MPKASAGALAHDVLLSDLQTILDSERDPRGALELVKRRIAGEARLASDDELGERPGFDELKQAVRAAPERPHGQVAHDSGGEPGKADELPAAASTEEAPSGSLNTES